MNDKKGSAYGFKIPADQRQSWGSLAMIWTGSMICVPSLMVGGILSGGLSFSSIIACILIGYAIICVYMCLMGIQGCDTGLPTVSVASATLGEKGAQFIISLLLAIACIGWFGVQSAVCGSAFSAMIEGITGFVLPGPVSAVIWGIIMLLTAMFGYNAMKYLNYIAVPALILVLGYALYAAVIKDNGFATVVAHKPEATMTIVDGIGWVIASFALGGVIAGDYCRYAKNRGDVIKSSVLGLLPSGLIVLVIGASLSIVTGQYDISSVLTTLGLPAIGLLALVLATWTTNVTNAYSGGIAVSNLLGFDESKFKITTCVAGLVGTALGAISIMDAFGGFSALFQGFLGLLSSFIPPVAGVIIAGYWIVGKGKPENFRPLSGVNAAGVIAFILGAAVAWVTANVIPFFSGPINGIIVSLIAYVILNKLMPAKAEPINFQEAAK